MEDNANDTTSTGNDLTENGTPSYSTDIPFEGLVGGYMTLNTGYWGA